MARECPKSLQNAPELSETGPTWSESDRNGPKATKNDPKAVGNGPEAAENPQIFRKLYCAPLRISIITNAHVLTAGSDSSDRFGAFGQQRAATDHFSRFPHLSARLADATSANLADRKSTNVSANARCYGPLFAVPPPICETCRPTRLRQTSQIGAGNSFRAVGFDECLGQLVQQCAS